MTARQQSRELSNTFENDGVAIGAGLAVTFHMGSGTDTSTNRYLNLPEGRSFGIEVIPIVACSITEINDRQFKVAMSIGTGGFRPKYGIFEKIKIQAGSATVVEVHGKG